jgi:hypothetical protein
MRGFEKGIFVKAARMSGIARGVEGDLIGYGVSSQRFSARY